MNKHLGNLIATASSRSIKSAKFLGVAVFGVLIIGASSASTVVYANRYTEQINNLNNQNAASQAQQQGLRAEASGIQATISNLQAEISALEGQIGESRARDAQLKKEMAAAEEKLASEKVTLAANIKQIYVDDEMSTLEMLATSKDLGDYIDKKQYRNSVQAKINASVAQINALKEQLDKQQKEVQVLIANQQAMQARVAEQRAENKRLLSLNNQEQATIDATMKKRNAEIEKLKQLQAQENLRALGGSSSGGVAGGGGYPWGSAKCLHTGKVDGSCPNYDWAVNGAIYNWSPGMGGYGYRNCTDWVAFRVKQLGGHVPSGLGDAKKWDDRAPGKGYTVSDKPKKGAAAISNSGTYGHVMFVEEVNGDGSIVISDYNRAGTGKYDKSTLSVSAASKLSYVYF